MSKKPKKATKKIKRSTNGKSSNNPKSTTSGKNSKNKSSAARGSGAKTTITTGDKSTNVKKVTTFVPHEAKSKQTKASVKSTEVAEAEPSNEEFEVTITDSKAYENAISSRGSYTGTGPVPTVPTSQVPKSTSTMYQNPIFYPDVSNLTVQAPKLASMSAAKPPISLPELATPNTTANAFLDKEENATVLQPLISLEKTDQTRPPAAKESQTLQVSPKATAAQARSSANKPSTRPTNEPQQITEKEISLTLKPPASAAPASELARSQKVESQPMAPPSCPSPSRNACSASVTSRLSGGLSCTFDGHSSSPGGSESLTATPSNIEQFDKLFVPGTMQNFDSETSIGTPFDKAESHQTRSKQQQNVVKETKASTSRLAVHGTISTTYAPTGATANYLRSLTSLQATKSGSRSPPPDTVKRHLISCRTTEGSSDPIGVLYGSIEGFIDCRNATHVLTSSGLLKEGGGNVSLDICQVDAMDGLKLAKISLLEAKVNLLTIAPLVEGRVLLFDETSRGIELANTSHIKLDGDRVSLAIATLGPTPRFSLKGVGTLERNRFDQSKPHKVEVVSGSATLLLGNTVSGANRSIAIGTAPTRVDLVLVVQDAKEATIALDDSLFWDSRTHPFTLLTADASTSKRSETLIGKGRSGPMRINCGLQESDFVFTEVTEHSVEYLLLFGMRTDQGQTLAPLGIVTGHVDGFIHSPTVTLQDMAGPSLMLNMVLIDTHNRGLMALRRQVLSSEHLVIVTVGGSATGNLCGDLGGGFLLAASTQLILTCNRLLRLVSYGKEDRSGPMQLDKCGAQDVTAESKGHLAVYLGEITLLVTDGAKSLAYCTSN